MRNLNLYVCLNVYFCQALKGRAKVVIIRNEVTELFKQIFTKIQMVAFARNCFRVPIQWILCRNACGGKRSFG